MKLWVVEWATSRFARDWTYVAHFKNERDAHHRAQNRTVYYPGKPKYRVRSWSVEEYTRRFGRPPE